MKKVLILAVLSLTLFVSSKAQTLADSTLLRQQINVQIVPNNTRQITGLMLNQILNGQLNITSNNDKLVRTLIATNRANDSIAISAANYSISNRVPTSRTITINGVTQQLNTDASFTIAAPAQFNPIAGTGISLSGTYPNIVFNSTSSGAASLTANQTFTGNNTFVQPLLTSNIRSPYAGGTMYIDADANGNDGTAVVTFRAASVTMPGATATPLSFSAAGSFNGGSIGSGAGYKVMNRTIFTPQDNSTLRFMDNDEFTKMGTYIQNWQINDVAKTSQMTFAPSAILDLRSTAKGVLLPRMTTSQRDAIAAPAEGLEIYNLTTHAREFYNGTVWGVLTGDQTIAGNKYFSGDWLRLRSGYIGDASYILNSGDANQLGVSYPASGSFAVGNTMTALKVQNTGAIINDANGYITKAATAVLDLQSTTRGLLTPRMTTTQRDAIVSPAEGLEIYNLTTHAKEFYNGTAWKTITTN